MFNTSILLSCLELPNFMIEVINLRKNKVLDPIFTEMDLKVSNQVPMIQTKCTFLLHIKMSTLMICLEWSKFAIGGHTTRLI